MCKAYKGNATFPEGPAPSSLVLPEMYNDLNINYLIVSQDLKAICKTKKQEQGKIPGGPKPPKRF